ncbi:hypothetical protein [Nannocystis punicea]|uniref:Uncharacterized protein n=1 Tax=Nannocystis punicea TaxID=2995304 RepID=A0ABY7GWX1_9BACT|nr:hypothetical protein [Nannocystis poenicansa]WAS91443.1 hypothetical protein O0S08_35105 [Nannocystis poenicansa]
MFGMSLTERILIGILVLQVSVLPITLTGPLGLYLLLAAAA